MLWAIGEIIESPVHYLFDMSSSNNVFDDDLVQILGPQIHITDLTYKVHLVDGGYN